ncbi:hypothetical protein RRG08_052493 [Elysia crispata]|uniref:Uncharacterized protein n=1 Tax=Elysia crispata TaxID=231223 RepID=A0AAE1CJN2_9GAST|nr:hypothetical protein RRG08_052493 [Elysia crispata]
MICAQIGDASLNLYYTRLEEGYDCDDPLYNLWRTYHNELVSLMAPFPDTESGRPHTCTNSQAREKNALAIPSLTKGARRKKTLKLPALISSPDFRRILIEKEADDKAQEVKKKQRKIDLEERKKAKVIEEEQKKAKREEKKKEREEKKRQKEVQTQLRREERKRKQEENRKAKEKAQRQKKAKSRKTCKKFDNSDSDTSEDDSTMVLDDNSSDNFILDCGSDDSTVEELREPNDAAPAGTSIAVSELPNDSSLSQYLEVCHTKDPGETGYGDNRYEQPTKEQNLWLDLAADSISSITPTLPCVEDKL